MKYITSYFLKKFSHKRKECLLVQETGFKMERNLFCCCCSSKNAKLYRLEIGCSQERNTLGKSRDKAEKVYMILLYQVKDTSN